MRQNSRRSIIRAQVREFVLPPINDGLVLGRYSPIGHIAVAKALNLLTLTPFEHVAIDDDVISDVLVRAAILRKLTPEQIRAFVLREVKPIIGPEEILHMTLDVELFLEQDNL